MDEGRFALAAAPVTVVEVVDGNPDHNDGSQTTPANDVVVQHSDGSLASKERSPSEPSEIVTGRGRMKIRPVPYLRRSAPISRRHAGRTS